MSNSGRPPYTVNAYPQVGDPSFPGSEIYRPGDYAQLENAFMAKSWDYSPVEPTAVVKAVSWVPKEDWVIAPEIDYIADYWGGSPVFIFPSGMAVQLIGEEIRGEDEDDDLLLFADGLGNTYSTEDIDIRTPNEYRVNVLGDEGRLEFLLDGVKRWESTFPANGSAYPIVGGQAIWGGSIALSDAELTTYPAGEGCGASQWDPVELPTLPNRQDYISFDSIEGNGPDYNGNLVCLYRPLAQPQIDRNESYIDQNTNDQEASDEYAEINDQMFETLTTKWKISPNYLKGHVLRGQGRHAALKSVEANAIVSIDFITQVLAKQVVDLAIGESIGKLLEKLGGAAAGLLRRMARAAANRRSARETAEWLLGSNLGRQAKELYEKIYNKVFDTMEEHVSEFLDLYEQLPAAITEGVRFGTALSQAESLKEVMKNLPQNLVKDLTEKKTQLYDFVGQLLFENEINDRSFDVQQCGFNQPSNLNAIMDDHNGTILDTINDGYNSDPQAPGPTDVAANLIDKITKIREDFLNVIKNGWFAKFKKAIGDTEIQLGLPVAILSGMAAGALVFPLPGGRPAAAVFASAASVLNTIKSALKTIVIGLEIIQGAGSLVACQNIVGNYRINGRRVIWNNRVGGIPQEECI